MMQRYYFDIIKTGEALFGRRCLESIRYAAMIG
jgi:hypothetical protein